MFADKVEIQVKAGKGGDGRLSFRHEKYRAKGGPDGGDGGRGGNVIIQADHNLNTLSGFRTKKLIKAEPGQAGKSNRAAGKAGEDITIKVPVGTLVTEGGDQSADLTTDGQTAIIAQGGQGGFGNAHFTSSTRQAPRAAELGEPGEEKELVLELKLVADVGIIGLPNAGKSTLLSVISNAKPEIGDYPFTTLIPNLGVVDIDKDSFLAADIPGLIEGASQGKGLGDEFLRHIERTAVLLHLIDAHSDDLVKDYQTIQQELKDYQIDLTKKPQILALTKAEGLAKPQIDAKLAQLKPVIGKTKIFVISAVAHQNLDSLLRALVPFVTKSRHERQAAQKQAERVLIDEASMPDLWEIVLHKGKFQVKGLKIEGFARRTNWDNEDSVARLRDILTKMGVARELERSGIKPGDLVQIGQAELTWI